MAKGLGSFFSLFVNIFFPNRCLFCSGDIEKGCCVCERCRETIEIIQDRFCARCGAPLQKTSPESGLRCDQCREFDYSFRRNESLGVFHGKMRELIHIYKFNRRRSLSLLFSDLLKAYKASYIVAHDVIVSVPLSKTRYNERGFNQSSLIALELSKRVGIPFYHRGLIREGRSQPQSSMNRIEERLKNFSDRFIVRERLRELLVKRDVLLFDDVLTSGATASTCARSLYAAGARSVDLLTLARAVKTKDGFEF